MRGTDCYAAGAMRDRTVIVSGGTGALGRAIVRRFLDAGDHVVVPWIQTGERDSAARLWSDVSSGRITLLQADVSVQRDAERVAAAAPDTEVLINTAGGFAGGDPTHIADLDLWERMFRVNLMTAVTLSRAIIPGMLERAHGCIANIASQSALTRPAGIAAYTASKAGVIVLTETLQKELAGTPLRVNAVAPGTIDTPANRLAMPSADTSSWTPPTKIADVLFWLASDEGATVRGAILPV